MKLSAALFLSFCVIAFSAGAAFCASSDAGHVVFVNPSPSQSDSPETPNTQQTLLVPDMSAFREVILTPEIAAKIAALFPDAQGKNVYSMLGNENITLNTGARSVTSDLASHLAETGEEIMLTFPEVTAIQPGIYVLGVSLESRADAGTLIDSVSTIAPAAVSALREVNAADIQEIMLLDMSANPVSAKRATNGRTYVSVPANQNMIAAVNFNAGETWTGSITKPVQLPIIAVEPITIEQIAERAEQTDPQTQTETHEETVDRIMNNIIHVVQEIVSRPEVIEEILTNEIIPPDILSRDVVSTDIKTFTSRDIIADPEEPTPAMQEAVQQEGYEIAAKLNTIQVMQSGFYIFKVTLSEQSFNDLRGTTVENLKVYALSDSEIEILPSFIMGMISTFELLTMSGEKITSIGMREFLLVGLLQSGQPFSVYLAKLLLALLLGGCNSGAGVYAVLVVSGIIYIVFRTHKKL